MKCFDCQTDLGAEKLIKAVKGPLYCMKCAVKDFSEQDLLDYGEDVVPSDIGIYPMCEWCGEESKEIVNTRFGKICPVCNNLLEE